MKLKNILVGFVVGSVGGVTLALLNAPKSGKELQDSFSDSSSTFKSASNQIKEEFGNIKNSVLRAKHETSNISELTNEIKTLVSNFQADIEPNISHIKSGVNDISDRATKIQTKFEDNNK